MYIKHYNINFLTFYIIVAEAAKSKNITIPEEILTKWNEVLNYNAIPLSSANEIKKDLILFCKIWEIKDNDITN